MAQELFEVVFLQLVSMFGVHVGLMVCRQLPEKVYAGRYLLANCCLPASPRTPVSGRVED